jgi:putative membrane protein
MIAALKFVHIATIAVWCAGLICLPGLYAQRAHAHEDDRLYRLQAFVRFAYIGIISPAAFLAVASGTALIFAAETYDVWFMVKLAFVGALVVIHVLTGLVIIRLFNDGEVYPAWRFVGVTVATVFVVVAILVIVLAKPVIDVEFLPDLFFTPGALGEALSGLNPWARR